MFPHLRVWRLDSGEVCQVEIYKFDPDWRAKSWAKSPRENLPFGYETYELCDKNHPLFHEVYAAINNYKKHNRFSHNLYGIAMHKWTDSHQAQYPSGLY